VGGFALLIGLGILAGFLSSFYRTEHQARAERAFRSGNELFARERYDESIAQYREALSMTHRTDYRLALGRALARAGRPQEAIIYLEEVLREQPTNGPAHLEIARIDAAGGRVNDAVSHYQRAVYGAWPDHPDENRLAARLEMIEALEKNGRQSQAAAELAALGASRPDDLALKKQIAQRLAALGMTDRAVELWSDVLRRDPQDKNAARGLAQAQLALNDFAACRDAFRKAGDSEHAALCARALELDRRRGRELLAAVKKDFASCVETVPAVPRGMEDSDAAEQLWKQRLQMCPTPPSPDSPVTRVMNKVLAQQ
jgi:tetratricopeptide (TPR) repeat protein